MEKDKDKTETEIKISLANDESIECDKLIAFTAAEDEENFNEHLMIGDWDLEELSDILVYLKIMAKEDLFKQLNGEEKQLFEEIETKKEEMEVELYSSLNAKEKELYDKLYHPVRFKSELDISDEFDQEIEEFFDELLTDLKNNQQLELSNNQPDDKVVNLADYRK